MPSLAVVALPNKLKRSAVTVTSARPSPPAVAVDAASSGDETGSEGSEGSAWAAQVKQIAMAPTAIAVFRLTATGVAKAGSPNVSRDGTVDRRTKLSW